MNPAVFKSISRKTFKICLLLCLTSSLAFAQEGKLDNLLKERDKLIEEYNYYNSQNSNFWGKKSKKDLLNIIETLKKIINKDTEIVAAVRAEGLQNRAELTVKQEQISKETKNVSSAVNERIYELNQQVGNLQNLVKRKEQQVRDLQDRLQEEREEKYNHDRITTIIAVAAGLLLMYTIILHIRLSRTNAKPKRKPRKK